MSLLLLANVLCAASDLPPSQAVIVVVGADGEPSYARLFEAWADRWREAAATGNAHFELIGRQPETDTGDRDLVRKRLADQPVSGAEPLWLVLIGHGTFDGQQAKFNLRGPDLSADDLADWLRAFQRPLAIVNCTSSSSPFINRLSGANRVVVTATRSGAELNFARFGEHLAAAITDPAADLDKDDQTSLLEAFITASKRTAEYYQREARLATEHALLDDNGDSLGTPADWFRGVRAVRRAKDGAALDGLRANQMHLVRSERERRIPAEIRSQRDELELAIAALRDKKANMPEDAYYTELEALLLRLARLLQSLDPPADQSTGCRLQLPGHRISLCAGSRGLEDSAT